MLHPNQWPTAQDAFESAIQMGFLSVNPKDSNYAGTVMFMGLANDGAMLFKNIDTRQTYRCE